MQIIAFLALLAFFIIIFSAKELNLKNKIILASALAVISILAFLYEYKFDKKEQKIRNIVIAFEEGKEIICDGLNINNTKFRYENGTQSFVSKTQFITISIKKCQEKKW